MLNRRQFLGWLGKASVVVAGVATAPATAIPALSKSRNDVTENIPTPGGYADRRITPPLRSGSGTRITSEQITNNALKVLHQKVNFMGKATNV